ncbi:MAG: ribonuclease J [Halanaerobiales bacterium]|nr:ribonuclease J [Halanaerobiales bacterium]
MIKKSKIESKNVSMISLGGVGEIGKNMMIVEIGNEILIIDAGIMFPENELLGIDYVIPDITYLIENKDRIQGIVLTHGHEDHIGALPYVLREIKVPIYGTRLTLGLVEGKLKEHHRLSGIKLRVVNPGSTVMVGSFKVDFVRVNHSIADACALAIHTLHGAIVYASDFKFDHTPVDGHVADFYKLAELGHNGVLALFSDSTNVEREGVTLSEKVVGESIEEAVRVAEGRIIVATFASNIHRIQQVVDAAFNYNRKVAITGRSMINYVNIARDLGYLHIPDGMMVDLKDTHRYRAEQICLLTTGSQGEPMAALTRMARGDHRQITIEYGDTVIISASAIPGNEKFVAQTINKLFVRGAHVVYDAVSGVHVSGHASQEELKLMINLTKPRYFVPVHGESRHLHHHAELAKEVGIPPENIFIIEPGSVLQLTRDNAKISGSVPAGQVLIDGLGVGDVGNIVLRDRRLLSQDGIVIVVLTIDKGTARIVAGPDMITRGFVYIRESEELIKEATEKVKSALERCETQGITDWGTLKSAIRDSLSTFIYQKIKRKPMILPVIMEI